ncbi:hypothetical protein [Pseudonocardia sp. GCM10023141]
MTEFGAVATAVIGLLLAVLMSAWALVAVLLLAVARGVTAVVTWHR